MSADNPGPRQFAGPPLSRAHRMPASTPCGGGACAPPRLRAPPSLVLGRIPSRREDIAALRRRPQRCRLGGPRV